MSAGQQVRRWWRRTTAPGKPVVTYALIGAIFLVYVAQMVPGSPVTGLLAYDARYSVPTTGAPFEPWRMLTAAFVHSPSSVLHVLFNLISLYLFGQGVEGMLGRARFLVLYVLSAIGGSIAVLLYSIATGFPITVVGASGAVFGIFGAFFVIQRRLGGDVGGIVVLVVLNLGLGFFVSGISWQAHVGGLVVGALTAWIFMLTRGPRRRNAQVASIALWALVLLVVALSPAFLLA